MIDIIYSVIIGLIIGLIVYIITKGIIKVKGPDSNVIKKKIYYYKGKYYKFVPVIENRMIKM